MTSEWTSVRTLTPLLRRHAVRAALVVVTGTGVACTEGVGLGLFIPLAQGIEGDGAAGRLGTFVLAPFAGLPPATRGRAILVAIVVLLAVRNLLVLAHAAMAGRVTSDLAHELRTDAMAAVLAADETTLARRDTGAWLALLESQTWETAAAAGTLLGIATRVGRIAVFAAGLLWISPPTTAVVLAALGLVSIGVRRLARRVDALGDAEKRAWEAMAQRMVEILRALRTVRVFGREAHELDRLAWVSDVERGTFRRLQLLQAVVPPASELLVATLMLAVVWVSLATPGQVPAALAVLAILYRLHPQVAQLDGLRVALAAGRAPAEAVTALLASSPPARPAAAPVPAPLARGITFRDVSYTHADGTRGLAGASLVIPAGRTTVVVGPSGAGKSTLVRLLLRLAEPEHGTIEADGVPLAAVDAAAWRARIAVVGQDIPLLDATIAENVAYGAGGRLDLDAIRAAARRADADAFVMALPDRYATRMGAGGVRLSGGERQRIALARALARDPEILVLDEATNAVDGISTALILRTLLEVGRGRTVVVVTHRADLVDAAEHVVVLDAGRVVEHGSAAALAGRGGLFARLRTAGAPPAARAS